METWFWILGWSLSILTISGNGSIIFLVCSRRKTKIEVAATVLGFPLLRKVDVTWLEGEKRKMRYMEPKNTT